MGREQARTDAASTREGGTRMRRALSALGVSSTAALIGAAGGATWYYASRIIDPPDATWPPVPVAADRVEIVDAPRSVGIGGQMRTVVDVRGAEAARTGVWGLAWEGGYGRVHEVVTQVGTRAERVFEPILGRPAGGEAAWLDAYAYPHDPGTLGLEVTDVEIDSPVGALPTWRVAPPEATAAGPTWAIFVHGRSARRHEAFRMLPTVANAGLTSLVLAYRNDPDAPASPDGRSHLGTTEWEDVAAAVRFALDSGARDVVLVGYSMGGACVANLVRISSLADRVRAVVLEAPVLDWGPVIRLAAVERGLPSRLLPLLLSGSMALAGVRAGIDWHGLAHLDDPDAYTTPTLLIHGDADETVPVELADALAATRPDVVTYLRVAGAGHVRSWNHDPSRYEAAVRDFLTGIL